MSIPASLRSHIQRKVKDALALKPVNFQLKSSELPGVADRFVEALALLHPSNSKQFSETGMKLAKAIGVLSFDPKLLSSIDDALVTSVLSQYDGYLQTNQSIFESITNHHVNIMSEEWKNVTNDNESLNVYSQAANSMGGKKWVVECNHWMETFALDYFRSGVARKHHIKQQRSKHGNIERSKEELDAENAEFGKLQADLLKTDENGGFSRLRLLDVGSCYNPIAKSKESAKFDVTALDLYPADPSVYRCDFLNLLVGPEGSAPVAVTVTDETAVDTPGTGENSSTKRRKVEEHTSPLTESTLPLCESSQRLVQLPAGAYDAVTMSLVLNYLPTSEQRLDMVRKARALLVSPAHSGAHTDGAGEAESKQPPHRNGILLIAEKQSIFKSPTSGNNQKTSKVTTLPVADSNAASEVAKAVEKEVDLYSNWVRAINSCGFELVKYHYLPTSDGRKSHLFAFATVNLDSGIVDHSLKLSIKQDFEGQLL